MSDDDAMKRSKEKATEADRNIPESNDPATYEEDGNSDNANSASDNVGHDGSDHSAAPESVNERNLQDAPSRWTLYQLLEVQNDASEEDIENAYQKVYDQKNSALTGQLSQNDLDELNEAKDWLLNNRKFYDKHLREASFEELRIDLQTCQNIYHYLQEFIHPDVNKFLVSDEYLQNEWALYFLKKYPDQKAWKPLPKT